MIELLIASVFSVEGLAVFTSIGWTLSEYLGSNPRTKDNNVVQLLVHVMRKVTPHTKGDDRMRVILRELQSLKQDVETVKKEGFLHEDFDNLGRGR